jgi:hypothetical protein
MGFGKNFRPGNKQGGSKPRPDLSTQFSVKQGNGYYKGPSYGVWVNDKGGPAFTATLTPAMVQELAEFFGALAEQRMGCKASTFDNRQGDNSESKPASGGFGKKASGFGAKKANPFKAQSEETEEPEFD